MRKCFHQNCDRWQRYVVKAMQLVILFAEPALPYQIYCQPEILRHLLTMTSTMISRAERDGPRSVNAKIHMVIIRNHLDNRTAANSGFLAIDRKKAIMQWSPISKSNSTKLDASKLGENRIE